MHEFSIAEALLKAALQVADAQGGASVERLRVRLGRLRQVVPDLLVFAFTALAKDTIADGAILEWEWVAPQVCCRGCGAVFEPESIFWICPQCEGRGGEVLAGEELILDRVILKDERGILPGGP